MRQLQTNRLVIVLKARQIGLTWTCLAYALWLMLFRPAATVLLFSRRDDESVHLLDFRLKGMYSRLPDWMRARAVVKDNGHTWELSNGSMALAFPTTAGDSYTATLVIVDEADLVPDMGRLMNAVKPTIDGGGSMVLLSRVNKDTPGSEFQRTYIGAKRGDTGWTPIFLPWHVRPERDAAWYAAQKADILARTDALDDLYQQYPATDAEALAPRSKDKRISGQWLLKVYVPLDPDEDAAATMAALPQLRVYVKPQPGRRYVLGADPAEGNPSSDPSALTVQDADTGEEVAALAGQFEPAVFAGHIATIATAYHGAGVLVERNNHGHAVLLWLRSHRADLTLLKGYDGKEGYLSNAPGKATLYSAMADACRDEDTVIHSFSVYQQLASIEGRSLRAPNGEHDDEADGYALATVARSLAPAQRKPAPQAQIKSHAAGLRDRLGG